MLKKKKGNMEGNKWKQNDEMEKKKIQTEEDE